MCVMAREDEVENEQEVAQPTEADATEASVDEEYVEDVGDDVDDGKVGVILSYTFFFVHELLLWQKKTFTFSCIQFHI